MEKRIETALETFLNKIAFCRFCRPPLTLGERREKMKIHAAEVLMKEDVIAKELLEILVCPICKSELNLIEYQPGEHGLQCRKGCGIYPIREGIPVMLTDEIIKPK